MYSLILLAALTFSANPSYDDRPLVDYFINNRTEQCFVLDRASNKDVVSIAATGFGMYAWAVAAEEKIISRDDAISWIRTAMKSAADANVGNHGWLYHFMDRRGFPIWNKEVSSIDTAIFYSCARKAAKKLGDPTLILEVEVAIAAIDVPFMMDGEFFRHGFTWHENVVQYIPYAWDEYSEGWLIYKLFNIPYRPTRVVYSLPLFVYYLPICFADSTERDVLIKQLRKAVDYQIANYGTFGYTACDGPSGYTCMEPQIISPLAISACKPFIGDRCTQLLAELKVGPFIPAISLKTNWYSNDHIGIDDGMALLCNRYLHE